MVQEAEAPGVRGRLVPSSEKKEVKLQGPVTSSDIGEIVLFLGTTGKWISCHVKFMSKINTIWNLYIPVLFPSQGRGEIMSYQEESQPLCKQGRGVEVADDS